jgi:4-diphosphocytidyl-2-C-methyl-D-erythritol kinase
MGAGLGGGSSDAASALRLANEIWSIGATTAELRALGAELGSDVPFFLGTPTAFAEGRGEELTPAPALYPFHVVVATPRCHVETAGAYRALAEYRAASLGGKYGNRWPDFRGKFERDPQNPEIYRDLFNDFEAPIVAAYPEIQAVRDLLNTFEPEKAMLTGSGASLFALFRQEDRARECLAEIAAHCRFSTLTRFSFS